MRLNKIWLWNAYDNDHLIQGSWCLAHGITAADGRTKPTCLWAGCCWDSRWREVKVGGLALCAWRWTLKQDKESKFLLTAWKKAIATLSGHAVESIQCSYWSNKAQGLQCRKEVRETRSGAWNLKTRMWVREERENSMWVCIIACLNFRLL